MRAGKTGVAALAAAAVFGLAMATPVGAWQRGEVEVFATLPAGATGPEGITADSAGNVYVTTFGFNNKGDVPGTGQLYVFDRNGKLLRQVAVQGSSEHLLGLGIHPTTGALLVIDFGKANVLSVNPQTGA